MEDRASITAAARDLRYWNARRATARVVSYTGDAGQVRFGAVVTIVREDGREQTFRIVGEDEADPSQGSISHISPLARSLFGKRVGDVVRARTMPKSNRLPDKPPNGLRQSLPLGRFQ
jgi:transcription elongation GreA/GreB family factor